MGRLRLRLLLLLLLLPTVIAQELPALLAALEDHPGLVASQALLEAAEIRLDAMDVPVSLSASGGYARVAVDDPNDLFTDPKGSGQLALEATFRPFLFGDIADLASQREIDRAQAELSHREARASLEAQAVEAAVGLLLAEQAVFLADAAAELAARGLEATRTRFQRGAATSTDVLRAEQQLDRASDRLLVAEADLELATATLETLVGSARLSDLPDLEPTTGETPEVIRARLDLRLAELGIRSAERNLLPTAQASYSWNLSDDRSTVSLSLESRTLQPSLQYRYQDSEPGAMVAAPADPLAASVRGTFSIGVSLTLSADTVAAVDAARRQLEAARAGVIDATDRAGLTSRSIDNALAASARQLELAMTELALSRRDLDQTLTRLELGLATDLEADQMRLAVAQAELTLSSARLEQLSRILDSYRSYAIPLSEVIK